MKIKITALTALLLCNLIACDTKKGGSSSNKQHKKAEEAQTLALDISSEKPSPPPTAESKNFVSPVIVKDEEISIPHHHSGS